jgi:hypothetical protein
MCRVLLAELPHGFMAKEKPEGSIPSGFSSI